MATTTLPDESTVQALTDALRGDLLYPGDPGYEASRTVWNGMVQKYPSMVVRAQGTSDVVATVEFARETGIDLAVKAGGHSVAGLSVCEDGLLLDLSGMNHVHVDPDARTARVEGGATLGDLDHESQAFGLATTMGIATPTGVAGLTLGGGIGYLARAYGLACDNLVAAEVVTADGDLVHASEERNPDLFWALRGGGGNFGVVTSMTFRLHELGPEVYAGAVFYHMDDAREVLQQYREFLADAPDEVCCYSGIAAIPPVEPFPEELHGEPSLYLLGCYAGSVEAGEAALAPISSMADPILDGVMPMPYTALQSMFDDANPNGNRYYWKSEFVPTLSDGAIDAFVGYIEDEGLATPFTSLGFESMGGAIAEVDPTETAYPHREAAYNLGIWGNWTDPEDDERVKAWVRGYLDAMSPYTSDGVYSNYLDTDDGDRLRAAYGPNADRLVAVKTEWDPENVFRFNRNIEPAN